MITMHIDAERLLNFLESVPRQIPFSMALALTKLAQAARDAIKEEMPKVFDRPTPYTINSVRMTPAKKDMLQSSVHLARPGGSARTGRSRFLEAEVEGGIRKGRGFETLMQRKNSLISGMQASFGGAAPLDQFGNIKPGFYNLLLSALQSQRDGYTNQTDKSFTRGLKAGKQVGFFIGRPGAGEQPLGLWSREYKLLNAPSDGRVRKARSTKVTRAFGKKMKSSYIFTKVRPILIFTKAGTYHSRLPFEQLVQATITEQQARIMQEAIDRALGGRK